MVNRLCMRLCLCVCVVVVHRGFLSSRRQTSDGSRDPQRQTRHPHHCECSCRDSLKFKLYWNTKSNVRPLENWPKHVFLCVCQESTYGTHIHEKREEREARFCNTVHDIVNREGRCLIPVFALGRAQELLLILGEMTWHCGPFSICAPDWCYETSRPEYCPKSKSRFRQASQCLNELWCFQSTGWELSVHGRHGENSLIPAVLQLYSAGSDVSVRF